ncbi:MAG: hypothetical protein JNM93_06590 [Bacteriovoracaceae bacterium]|nr:hypothetical protein [Bacteriovoracaceae bacterium]
MKLFTFLILALSLLVSCMEQKADSNKSTVVQAQEPLSSPLLKQQKLTCENSTNCSPLVAKVVIQPFGQKNLITCTGFLIEKNVIMTHPSCLNGFQVLDNCSENIRVIFADTPDVPAENLECQKLFYYEKNPQNRDQLYIKISSSESARDFYQLLKSELPNKTRYTVMSVNQASDNKNATLATAKCQTQFRGLMLPDYESDRSRSITFGECLVGNSSLGAPVFNEFSEVVAFVNSTLQEKNLKELSKNLDIFKKFPKTLATAENFYCKKLPDFVGGYTERRCTGSSFYRTAVSQENIYFSLNTFFLQSELPATLMDNWANKLKPDFAKWDQIKVIIHTEDNKIDRTRFLVYPQIKCLKPFQDWAKYVKKSGLKKMPPIKDLEAIELPIWLVQPMFNQDGILEINTELTGFSYSLRPRIYIKYHNNNLTPVTTEANLVVTEMPDTAIDDLVRPQHMRALTEKIEVEKVDIPDCP